MDITNPYPRLSDVQESNQEIEGSFVRFKSMVTPEDVRNLGLIGVPNVFPMTGQPISDEYISYHLQAAIGEIEMSGLMFSPVIGHHIDDFHDGNNLGGARYFPVILKRWPMRKIESIELRFPNAARENAALMYRIPDDWITWEQTKVNIVATTGFLSPTVIQGGASMPYFTLFNSSYRPMSFRVNYQAGFDQDKIPVIAWRFVIDLTTYNILSEIGPLLFPTTGVSVGMDSLSQSAQYPGYRLFLDRLKQLEVRIEKTRQLINGYYGNQFSMEFAGI